MDDTTLLQKFVAWLVSVTLGALTILGIVRRSIVGIVDGRIDPLKEDIRRMEEAHTEDILMLNRRIDDTRNDLARRTDHLHADVRTILGAFVTRGVHATQQADDQ